jgi:hypothetical protein
MIFKKNGVEATKIQWVAPTEREDGSAYGATEHAGYELGTTDDLGVIHPWVSVPAAYDITEWPLDQLNISAEGEHTVALRTVDTGGRVSEWSAPVVFTVETAKPNAPTGFAVS